jgi:anhydro-N-acetylmuramic acid kinase
MNTSSKPLEKSVILGCMSGTSVDGIDLAIVTTDGVTDVSEGPTFYRGYTDEERNIIRQAFSRKAKDHVTDEAERIVTEAHIDAIQSFRDQCKVEFNIIAFHGQTITHDPADNFTWQIGDAEILARAISAPVIYDFRGDDVKQGGQGAPLLPIYHRALLIKSQIALPSVIINIGGVSNITYLSHDDNLIAFDCGAGNALMDDVMKHYFGKPYDQQGQVARRGIVHENLLDELLSHTFFSAPFPKSLDRNAWDVTNLQTLAPEDQMATLIEFTARGIAKGVGDLPEKPLSIYVTGGGRHNDYLMELIGRRTNTNTLSVDVLGWDGDFMEAQGFAYMGARILNQLPISFPQTTGVPHPMVGGKIFRP